MYIETVIIGWSINLALRQYCDPEMDESILGNSVRRFAGSIGHQGQRQQPGMCFYPAVLPPLVPKLKSVCNLSRNASAAISRCR
jgi:hypothetical protein